MQNFKQNISAGLSTQFAVGDPRKDSFVSGTYTVTRGALQQSGRVEIDSKGNYSFPYVGADCGVSLTASATHNKILLKVVADSSDNNISVFECSLTQSKR